jgi:hypothetical protein
VETFQPIIQNPYPGEILLTLILGLANNGLSS